MNRLITVGKGRRATNQVVSTRYTLDPNAKCGVREHVTLATPQDISDTAKLRTLALGDAGREWPDHG